MKDRASVLPPSRQACPVQWSAFTMKALLPLALLTLAACSHVPGPVEVRTVEVKVPVVTNCVRKDQIPAVPAKIGASLNGDAQHDLELVAASAIRLRSRLEVATALLAGCAQ